MGNPPRMGEPSEFTVTQSTVEIRHWHSKKASVAPGLHGKLQQCQSKKPKTGDAILQRNFWVPKQTQIRPCYGLATEKPSSLDLWQDLLHLEADNQPMVTDRCQGTIQPGMKKLMSINHGSPGFLMQSRLDSNH